MLLSAEVRLLSLTGPPGVGKSRLGMAVAASCLEAFSHGVRFVNLAPLCDAGLVGAEIAGAFGLPAAGADPLESLAAYLRSRQVLLFLDNFECVLPAAAWIGKLLERTPGVKVLTTTRERLRLRWERIFLVPPLPLPDLNLPAEPTMLLENPSVALFVQRALAVNAGFELSTENALAVANLCARLDGLPLAIELAAARASVLSPAEILGYLEDRFRLLGSTAPDLPEKHQTLKTAIDWSYTALPPAEAQFLRRLAVFSGSFSLEAAKSVGECMGTDLEVLERLIALVEKSLLAKVQGPGGETRFVLLESIREYLLELLRQQGELEDTRRRQAVFYREFAERLFLETRQGDQKAWFEALETENDNLRQSLQWSIDTNELAVGKRIAAAIWTFWWLHGHLGEGARWLELLLAEDPDPQDETHWRLIEGIGVLRGWQGDGEPARAFLMAALDNARARQDHLSMARILGEIGWIFSINGKTEEAAWLDEMLHTPLPEADAWDLAYAHLSLGNLLYEAGQERAAGIAIEKALAYFVTAGEKHGFILAQSKLSLIKHATGDLLGARQAMLDALEVAQQAIDLHLFTICLDNGVQLALKLLDGQKIPVEQAELFAEKIMQVFGAVDHLREIFERSRAPRERAAYRAATERLQSRLGENRYLSAWQSGRSMPAAQVIDILSNLLEIQPQPDQEPSNQGRERPSVLSERELEVLACVAQGLSNQEIAERLYITHRTVRFHITSILNKLGANNRTQAVVIANRLGLL